MPALHQIENINTKIEVIKKNKMGIVDLKRTIPEIQNKITPGAQQ